MLPGDCVQVEYLGAGHGGDNENESFAASEGGYRTRRFLPVPGLAGCSLALRGSPRAALPRLLVRELCKRNHASSRHVNNLCNVCIFCRARSVFPLVGAVKAVAMVESDPSAARTHE